MALADDRQAHGSQEPQTKAHRLNCTPEIHMMKS